MINARVMYMRPGNLFKDFVIEQETQTVSSTGRAIWAHDGDGTRIIRGCLAESTDEQRIRHSSKEHIVTHTIVQSGKPRAKRGDRLALEDRTFLITDIDETGSLGAATIYYVEERRDTV